MIYAKVKMTKATCEEMNGEEELHFAMRQSYQVAVVYENQQFRKK